MLCKIIVLNSSNMSAMSDHGLDFCFFVFAMNNILEQLEKCEY